MKSLYRKMIILLIIVVLANFGTTPLPSQAQSDTASLTPLDQYGGGVARVTVAGSFAYVGLGPRLVRLSLTNPLKPTFAGQSNNLPGVITAIAVQGQVAYVTDSAKNLHIFDLSAGTLETPVTTMILPAAGTDLAADATQLIVGEGSYGIEAYALSNPFAPSFSIKRTCPGEANGVTLASGTVFVACTTGGVGYFPDFYDIGKNGIAYPLSSPREALDVAVSGNNVFVVTGPYGMTSLELTTSDGSSPLLIYKSEINFSNTSTRLVLSGSRAYISVQDMNYWNPTSNGSALEIVDISNPSHLLQIGYLNYRGDGVDIAVQGSTAFLAGMDGGLRVIDMSTPAAPTAASTYNPLGTTVHLQAAPSRLFAASDWQGLKILSSSIDGKMLPLGQYSSSGLSTLWTVVDGDYAYLGNRSPSMSIVNIANPSAPSLVGNYAAAYETFYVGKSSSTVYLGQWVDASPYHTRIQEVDVSNPSAPAAGFYNDLPSSGEHSYISDGYIYVANGSGGLRILDLTSLAEVGYSKSAPYANDVAVYGNTAYVLNMDTVPPYTGTSNAIYVFDVTNKSAPAYVRKITLNGQSMRLAVSGRTLYAAACTGGLHIYDLSTPTNPVQTAVYNPPGCSASIAALNNLVYLGTVESGVYSLWYEQPQVAVIPVSGGTQVDENGMIELIFPPDAFNAPTTVTLRRPSPSERPPFESAYSQGLVWGGVYYTATGPAVALKPYKVNLFFTHDMLTTIKQETLGLFYWSGSVWVKESSLAQALMDAEATGGGSDLVKVTFTSTHFGDFAVFAESKLINLFIPAVLN